MPTFVKTRQMWTSAATPTMETRTFLSLAALTASITLPGSQVESAANKISTCAAMFFHNLKRTSIESCRVGSLVRKALPIFGNMCAEDSASTSLWP